MFNYFFVSVLYWLENKSQCLFTSHSVFYKTLKSILLCYLGFYILVNFLSICSPSNPQNAMKMYTWWMNVWCRTPCGQLELCCVLSYSQRLLRKTWPMLSWSWSNPTRLPKVSPPALSMPRSSLTRTSCNSMSSSMILFNTCHLSYLWKLIFIFSHVPSVWCGAPFLWHSRCLREVQGSSLKKSRSAALEQIFWNKIFWVWALRGKDADSESI